MNSENINNELEQAVVNTEQNKNEYEEKINKRNKELIDGLYHNNSFIFTWFNGRILPEGHPDYFKNRIDIEIKKINGNLSGYIKYENKEYSLNEEKFIKLEKLISSNIKKIVKLTLNQKEKKESGGVDKITIKYKTLLSVIDVYSTNDPTLFLMRFERKIENLLFN